MDITLQVCYNQSTHSLPAEEENGRYKKGDILNVIIPKAPEAPSQNNRFVFIHLDSVPDSYVNILNIINPDVSNRRLYRIDFDLLQPETIITIEADRQVTKVWIPEYKAMLKNINTDAPIADEELI